MMNFRGLILLFRTLVLVFCLLLGLMFFTFLIQVDPALFDSVASEPVEEKSSLVLWKAPDFSSVPDTKEGEEIKYGRDLISRTSSFIGPIGSISSKANGMNCQNCHLDAGTKPYGNNFGSVASTYPKFRARSGTIESIEKRVNDCIERSLNGASMDTLSKEMRSIIAYLKWLGKDVPQGQIAAGSGLYQLKWLERAADSKKGKKLYIQKCAVCHGNSGEGQRLTEKGNYINPPLSGEYSFTTSAGLYRISNFAKYIYANMPYGASFEQPVLTEEQSWDIAAYVLNLPRPKKEFTGDWPKIELKPYDYPFGSFADGFSEQQHKYGPFRPIEEFYKKK
jgi:thiosulfate dehydrogenase